MLKKTVKKNTENNTKKYMRNTPSERQNINPSNRTVKPQNTGNPTQKNTKKTARKNTPKTVQKNTKKIPQKNTQKTIQKNIQKPQQTVAPKSPQTNTQKQPQNNIQNTAPYNKKADKELSRVMKEKTPAQKKRGYRGGNYILYYIFAAIVVAVVMVILSNTVLFRCTEIEVAGNVSYTAEQIITGSGLKTGDNLLHIDAAAAAKKVVDICLFIDEAEVRKSFPTKLIISVKEAEVCLCVSENGINAAVSRGGRVIKHLENTENVIILKGFEPESLELGAWLKSKNETKTELPWEMLTLMEEAKLTNITEIDISDRYSPKVTIDNRILLNLGSATELESKFIVAKALIDTEIGANESATISLSNPEKPAVRINSGSAPQTPSDDTENKTEENSEEDTENAPENSPQG